MGSLRDSMRVDLPTCDRPTRRMLITDWFWAWGPERKRKSAGRIDGTKHYLNVMKWVLW